LLLRKEYAPWRYSNDKCKLKTVPNTKPDIIIRDNEKGTLGGDVAISGDKCDQKRS
jgi:hypothetical protein